MRAKTLGIVLLIAVILVTIFQNTETVETRILFATIAMPRFLLLLVTLLIGIALGYIGGARVRDKEKKD